MGSIDTITVQDNIEADNAYDQLTIESMYDAHIKYCKWLYSRLDELKAKEDDINQFKKIQEVMTAISFGVQAIGYYKNLLNK